MMGASYNAQDKSQRMGAGWDIFKQSTGSFIAATDCYIKEHCGESIVKDFVRVCHQLSDLRY